MLPDTFDRAAGGARRRPPQADRALPPHQAYDTLSEGNGNGRWDSWGYDDADYAYKNGRQMHAARAMISRLESGSGRHFVTTGGPHLQGNAQAFAEQRPFLPLRPRGSPHCS